MKLIIDSYAWIEFLIAGRHGPRVRDALGSADDLLTPDIVLAELARKFGRDGVPARLVEGHLRLVGSVSTIVGIDLPTAMGTITAEADLRKLTRTRHLGSPSFADAIILSMARIHDAKVLTGDPHFEGLPETEWLARN